MFNIIFYSLKHHFQLPTRMMNNTKPVISLPNDDIIQCASTQEKRKKINPRAVKAEVAVRENEATQ